jgi:hypothetical protein
LSRPQPRVLHPYIYMTKFPMKELSKIRSMRKDRRKNKKIKKYKKLTIMSN